MKIIASKTIDVSVNGSNVSFKAGVPTKCKPNVLVILENAKIPFEVILSEPEVVVPADVPEPPIFEEIPKVKVEKKVVKKSKKRK